MDCQNILHNKLGYLDVYIKQGKVYQELGKSEEAIICYQNAIRINADYIEPHYNLGHLYQSLGDYQQSIFFLVTSFKLILIMPMPTIIWVRSIRN